jgi:hypothetical protein
MRRVKWPSGPSCATDRARPGRGCRTQARDQGAGSGRWIGAPDQGATRVTLDSGQNAVQSHPGIAEMSVIRSARHRLTRDTLGRVSPGTTPASTPAPASRGRLPRSALATSRFQPSRGASRIRAARPRVRCIRDGAGRRASLSHSWLDGGLPWTRSSARAQGNAPDGPHPGRMEQNAEASVTGWGKTRGCGRRGGMLGTGGSTRR